MSRKKKKKIARTIILPNVLENPSGMSGQWNNRFFKQNAPVTLEVGCGKGEYTLALARANPEKNFIGVDLKADRIWTGSETAWQEELQNVGFLKIRAEELEQFFAEGEVSEIWLTFPDPYPKPSKASKRLMSPQFINIYRKLTINKGLLHLKTDNEPLFEYALTVFQEMNLSVQLCYHDLHNAPDAPEMLHKVLTTYEKRFMKQDIPIKYARVQLG